MPNTDDGYWEEPRQVSSKALEVNNYCLQEETSLRRDLSKARAAIRDLKAEMVQPAIRKSKPIGGQRLHSGVEKGLMASFKL